MKGLGLWLQLYNHQAIDIDLSIKMLRGILAHDGPH